ncbi:hydroxysteroid 11-beta-dehydrogenase 1-like protein [Lingula anatina]|uniref:Hydroxysteroid 11-beta-dehydrogenase 1-like protein n=1 Tax=Lingula anatina TaxID=7574 RepID=A0A1S3JWN4_LINAN|nr:hydroxysteroid 11-beta-dehydrogenase 1-like protein [Lingula anatina]|eukprot:XP_013414783.1 hydroxysteroid 11-beta-dehydrogenase 1-like protein [Lingula anatina]
MGYGLKMSLALSAVVIAYLLMYSGTKFDPADVQDKKVLITGASSGIGKQMACHFAKMGANLVLTARRENLLKEVIEKCKKLSPNPTASHAYIVADMKELEKTKEVIKFSVDSLKGLDILVLNHARIPKMFDMWFGSQQNLTDLATDMDINFRAYVHLASHALPHLLKSKGRIAFVSSVAEKIPIPGVAVYTASKHAMQGFFGVLRQEMVMRNTGVSITSCMVAGTGTEQVMENLQESEGETAMDFHLADPTVVALEIVQATVARQYEVYTSSDILTSILVFLGKISPELADQLTMKAFFG